MIISNIDGSLNLKMFKSIQSLHEDIRKNRRKIVETGNLFLFLIHEKKSFSICVFSISDVCPGSSETYRRNGHEIV